MFNIAVAGGCIISKKFSACEDERFLSLVKVLREADVAFCHLEGTICDKDDPEVYPAAEAGWTWIRMPKDFAEELKWAGFDIVSHASNHSMDYMYGGLYETWKALRKAGLPYAGTGMNLIDARKPAFLDTGKRRVALISSSSSTPDWARAANGIRDDRGRPGVNQLRTVYRLDRETAKSVKELAAKMGWWLTESDDEFMLNPPGLHNTITRFAESDQPGALLVADRSDVEANLEVIRAAKAQADFVMFHIHNHEWNPEETISVPPEFIRQLARDCIDAGADLFIAEGAHALLRGIEIYKGKPIFYDPGDLFKDGNSKIRPLSEYYWMRGLDPATGKWQITTEDSKVHAEKQKLPVASNPPGGYNTGKVLAVIVPVCTYDEEGRLREIKIYPAKHLQDNFAVRGLPGLETGESARRIIEYVAELSAPYGTKLTYEDGVGVIKVDQGDDRS